MKKIKDNKKIVTLTWVNLSELGDLAQLITELNRVVEEWIESEDSIKVNLLNMRGVYMNKVLFRDSRLMKTGAAEMAKRVVLLYADSLGLEDEKGEKLRSEIKRLSMQRSELLKKEMGGGNAAHGRGNPRGAAKCDIPSCRKRDSKRESARRQRSEDNCIRVQENIPKPEEKKEM